MRCMSPLYSILGDPSASEDFDFEIRVVTSVVCLPVGSSLLVSLANNGRVRFLHVFSLGVGRSSASVL